MYYQSRLVHCCLNCNALRQWNQMKMVLTLFGKVSFRPSYHKHCAILPSRWSKQSLNAKQNQRTALCNYTLASSDFHSSSNANRSAGLRCVLFWLGTSDGPSNVRGKPLSSVKRENIISGIHVTCTVHNCISTYLFATFLSEVQSLIPHTHCPWLSAYI